MDRSLVREVNSFLFRFKYPVTLSPRHFTLTGTTFCDICQPSRKLGSATNPHPSLMRRSKCASIIQINGFVSLNDVTNDLVYVHGKSFCFKAAALPAPQSSTISFYPRRQKITPLLNKITYGLILYTKYG